jgi:uncharacterized protein
LIVAESQATFHFSIDKFSFSPMKLHLNTTAGQNTIFAHGEGYIDINGTRHTEPVLLTPDWQHSPWQVGDIAALQFSDFAALLARQPTIVVFGSGAKFQFPDMRIIAAFSQAQIGFEVMDTGAACRTYNVLMSEGRNVAAALYI